MSALVITVPGEPRGKGRPRFVRATGRTYKDGNTESYEAKLAYAAHLAMAGRDLLDGALAVRVIAVFAIPASMSKSKRQLAGAGLLRPEKKPDADNILKFCDALNKVVWRDDKQVVDATVRKFYGDAPRIEIHVGSVESASQGFATHETGSGMAGAGDRRTVVGPETLSPRGTGVPA